MGSRSLKEAYSRVQFLCKPKIWYFLVHGSPKALNSTLIGIGGLFALAYKWMKGIVHVLCSHLLMSQNKCLFFSKHFTSYSSSRVVFFWWSGCNAEFEPMCHINFHTTVKWQTAILELSISLYHVQVQRSNFILRKQEWECCVISDMLIRRDVVMRKKNWYQDSLHWLFLAQHLRGVSIK